LSIPFRQMLGQKMKQMKQEIDKKGNGRESDGSDRIPLKKERPKIFSKHMS